VAEKSSPAGHVAFTNWQCDSSNSICKQYIENNIVLAKLLNHT